MIAGGRHGTFVPDPSWPSILELATELWGEPNKKFSKPDDVRFGAKGSKRVTPSTNTYHDYETGKGGGYIGMFRAVRGELPRRASKQAGKQTGDGKDGAKRDLPPWQDIGPRYPYTDGDGKLILEVVRTRSGAPRFHQRAPNGKGGWTWSVKHIPSHDRLLYRLPGLRASGDATVWITEGEKDADRLHDEGLVATCNIGGAGKWRNEYAEEFRGKPCVVLADNDPQAKDDKTGKPKFHSDGRPVLPGQDHAATVARSLVGIAASVKVLLLPGLPAKGDVSDYLDDVGTIEDVERLAAEAPEYQQRSDPEREPAAEPEPVWLEPVDLLADRDIGAPILTDQHVPDAIWPFIKDTAARLGVATSSVALAAVVAAASVISEDWLIQPKRNDDTWTEAARIWGAIVGPPSILKSPIIAITTAPVVSLEIVARKTFETELTRYRQAFREWKEAGKPDPAPIPPRAARYLVEDTSIEALQEVLRDDADGKLYAPQGKVLVRRDELSEFLAGMDRYTTNKGVERGAYLRLYNGGRFSIDRIGRGSFVANSWSGCILGGIQPEPIQRIAAQAADDGLLQRFMFDVPAPQAGGHAHAPDHRAIAAYRDLFPALAVSHPAELGEAPDHHDVVILHSDAHAAREDINQLAFALSNMPDTSERIQSAFGKWPGLFARLCLTYHLIEVAAARSRGDIGQSMSVVSPQTAGKVHAYMRAVLVPNMLRAESVMFASQQSSHAAWIAGYILAGKFNRVTARDIAKDYRALRPPEQRRTLDSTMDSLCMVGWVEPEEPHVPTNAPTAWHVNPGVHIQFAARAEAERKRRDAVRAAIAAHVASIRQSADDAA